MIGLKIPEMTFQFRESRKIFNLWILTLYDVYGLYTYALWTWDMLFGHGTCLLVGEEYVLCGYGICGYGRCLLVGEEYMDMEDVFLWRGLYAL